MTISTANEGREAWGLRDVQSDTGEMRSGISAEDAPICPALLCRALRGVLFGMGHSQGRRSAAGTLDHRAVRPQGYGGRQMQT